METQTEILIQQSGGFDSPYLSREIDSANEAGKTTCRDRVADFILSNHDKGNLRLFSMPSMHWRFEHLIESRHVAKCEFVAAERDMSVIRESRKWMPGHNARFFDRSFERVKFAGVCTDTAFMVHMDCQTFLRLGQPDVLARRDRQTWHSYRMWTAIWMDFTSQLSDVVDLSISKLGAGCDIDCETVPVAITVLGAREPRIIGNKLKALGSRENYIAEALSLSRHRRFQFCDSFRYVSASGSPMLTVMGLLVKKEIEPRRDDW